LGAFFLPWLLVALAFNRALLFSVAVVIGGRFATVLIKKY